MDKQKSFLDYCSSTLIQFGYTMLVLNFFCYFLGDAAREYSDIFRLGADGLAVPVVAQFFAVSVLVTVLRVLFFTDKFIKNMRIALRGCLMFLSIILVIGIFICAFGWFPITEVKAWIMFFLCFGVSTLGTFLLLSLKERMENKKMEEALHRIQRGEKKENE